MKTLKFTIASFCMMLALSTQACSSGASTASRDSDSTAICETNVAETNSAVDSASSVAASDDSASNSESVTVDGVTITIGANLVATLKQAKKITWDYNIDFGVVANIGNVWIAIDDSDLTQKGRDIINAIPSDMENDISFSIDYIKPSATINSFEAE